MWINQGALPRTRRGRCIRWVYYKRKYGTCDQWSVGENQLSGALGSRILKFENILDGVVRRDFLSPPFTGTNAASVRPLVLVVFEVAAALLDLAERMRISVGLKKSAYPKIAGISHPVQIS